MVQKTTMQKKKRYAARSRAIVSASKISAHLQNMNAKWFICITEAKSLTKAIKTKSNEIILTTRKNAHRATQSEREAQHEVLHDQRRSSGES